MKILVALTLLMPAVTQAQRLFVSNEGGNTVTDIDLKTNTVRKTFPVGNRPRGMALSLDGKRVYVTLGRDDALAVIDVEKDTVIDVIPANKDPEQVALSLDGKVAFV